MCVCACVLLLKLYCFVKLVTGQLCLLPACDARMLFQYMTGLWVPNFRWRKLSYTHIFCRITCIILEKNFAGWISQYQKCCCIRQGPPSITGKGSKTAAFIFLSKFSKIKTENIKKKAPPNLYHVLLPPRGSLALVNKSSFFSEAGEVEVPAGHRIEAQQRRGTQGGG